MRFSTTISGAAAAAAALLFAFQSGRGEQGPGPARILGVYGVGGVIGEDGTLWQYMPDRKKWVSIDEAFRGEDRETHILPLPVPVKDIQFMESWGFLVTRSGECWHYDLEANRWQNVGPPPMGR